MITITSPNPVELTVHVMADLETLGTKPGAAITEIGLVAFAKDHGILGKFYAAVELTDFNAAIEPGTLMWWLDPKRRTALDNWLSMPKIDLHSACAAASDWISQWDRGPEVTPTVNDPLAQRKPEFDYSLGSLWGKGATFDNVLLRAAFDRVGLDFPFSFRQDECYRTVAKRFPSIEFQPPVLAHQALNDATAQCSHLLDIAAAVEQFEL